MFDISEILPDLPRINIVDIGAMSLGEGTEPYFKLMELGIADIVGFEPIEEECQKLVSSAPDNYQYLPYFIGDGNSATFYECNYPMTSSLYEPNTKLLDKFQNLENLVRVAKKTRVKTKRLDAIGEIGEIDFLKIDVQGAELDVLKGAKEKLKNCLVIHSEVEFVPLYKNQPLFSDLDIYLRKNNFYFHRFAAIVGRMFKPLIDTQDANSWISQPLWSDAVYVTNFMKLGQLSTIKLTKLATILHTVYGSYDLCLATLIELDKKASSSFAEDYLNMLSNQ